jgi:NADPH-dependent 2,4-dienoyl-CoA reductase/sulfur reductase-like enzyme
VAQSRVPQTTRRDLLKHAAASAAAGILPMPAIAQSAPGRVVVIGGGFAGATCARFIKRFDPRLTVTLVEAVPAYVACPLSNSVIAGLRDFRVLEFGYDQVAGDQVALNIAPAATLDLDAGAVGLTNGVRLFYDRLVLAPGIDIRWDGLPGYSEAAAERMPHAWKGGEQTGLLRRQLEAMPDGGTVMISAPADPIRSPASPYERASLIAHYLKTGKPKAKLIILDGKDAFPMQRLFESGWKELYPNLEWVSLSSGGKVTSVEPGTMTLMTSAGRHKVDVANVIPPQKAGRLAELAGVTDRSGWCPVNPVTFESSLKPNVHVIGDAAIAGAMPKTAFAANAQAKVCAAAVVALMTGGKPAEQKLIDASYSLVAPDYGISTVAVYRPVAGDIKRIEGAGGESPVDAPASTRALEAQFAFGCFKTLTEEAFG